MLNGSVVFYPLKPADNAQVSFFSLLFLIYSNFVADLKVFEITARGGTVAYEMLQLALDRYSLAVAK